MPAVQVDNTLSLPRISTPPGSPEQIKISQGQAEELAYALTGDSQMKMDEILDQSKKIATTFLTEKNLEALVG